MHVSIIIPVYNVAPYVEQCIRSVMNQTMTEDVECIIVDDCGQDNSMALVEGMIAEYGGDIEFRFLHHDCNRGLSEARNTGLKAAKGDYILFLDSDDALTNKSVELLYAKVSEHKGIDVVLGKTKAQPYYDYIDISYYQGICVKPSHNWFVYNFYKHGKKIPVNAWNKLLRRQLLVENKLFFMPEIIHEDDQWVFHVLKHINTFAFIFEETLIHYRRAGSIMTSLTPYEDAKNWIIIMTDFCNNFYKPFDKLQLLYCLDKYFRQSMYKHCDVGISKLHFLFIRGSLRHKLCMLSILLIVWSCIHKTTNVFNFKLASYINGLYCKESQRLQSLL